MEEPFQLTANDRKDENSEVAAATAENIDFTTEGPINGVDDVDCCTSIITSNSATDDSKAQHITKSIIGPLSIDYQTSEPNSSISLQSTVENLRLQYDQVQSVLQQKEDIINMQRREMDVVDREKAALKRELEQSRREKETAVVKYAMAEKNLIDLKYNNEQLTKRLKDATKEVEGHSTRLKFVTGERERANKDLRKSIHECEALKTEIIGLETKLKWSQVKIKQDVTAKAGMEAKIAELQLQVNQFNENQVQNINMQRSEEKETEAQLILLKHMCEEREKESAALQIRVTTLKRDNDATSLLYRRSCEEIEELKLSNVRCDTLIEELELTTAGLTETLEATTKDLNDTSLILAEKQERFDEAMDLLNELADIKDNFDEQALELETIRAKEDHLMQFTKELTEKSVSLESRLTLSTAKASALTLENERIKDIFEEHKQCVIQLEANLAETNQRYELELKLLNDRLDASNNERNVLKLQLDNTLGELDAARRKHSQVVKELNREVTVLRTKLEPKGQNNGTEEVKEPSKKTLIDRIVRLQRALARQTEKIEFLENHCAALINELKSKS